MGTCSPCRLSDTKDADGGSTKPRKLMSVGPFEINADVEQWGRLISAGSAAGWAEPKPALDDVFEPEPAPEEEPVSAKEQIIKVLTEREGFFASMDQSISESCFEQYDIAASDPDGVRQDKKHRFMNRIITHPKFDSSRIVGCVIPDTSMDAQIDGKPLSTFLWQRKQIVPILRIDTGLQAEKNGVQLMRSNSMLVDSLLDKAANMEVFAIKVRSMIKLPDAVGIKSCIDQLIQVCQRISDKGLVPFLQPEIDTGSPDKGKCEQVLIDVLIDAFDRMNSDMRVCLILTIPSKPNCYLPFTRHTNVLRVTALSGGIERAAACTILEQNVGMVGNFARAFCGGLSVKQEDGEFASGLDTSCQRIFEASRRQKESTEKLARLSDQAGFIVSLGHASVRPMVTEEELASEKVDDILNELTVRIFTNPKFNSARIIAAIMSMEFAAFEIQGMSAAEYLWRVKGVIPFTMFPWDAIEVESDGVQLMKLPPNWEEMVDRAAALGIFGVQMRGLITRANKKGIEAVVSQQFGVGKKLMAKGLMPNMLLQVDINSPDKAKCEEMLLTAIMFELGNLTPDQKVTIVLTIPSKTNLYLQLLEHPNAVRIGAPSAGYKCMDACKVLSENIGMIGVFGRAFTERLKSTQSDDEFTTTIADTCKIIHEATVAVSAREEQTKKMSNQDGFVAIMDTLPKVMKRYGIDIEKLATEKLVNEKMHQMITRIVTNNSFDGSRALATIMNVLTMDAQICGMSAAKYLWSQKGTVPFLKIDNGLMPEANGVQLMQYGVKDVAPLMNLLDRAAASGIFGTKQRSFIKQPNATGIKAVIDQQIEMGRHVCARGLLPMLQPEVDINAPQKAAIEQMLLETLVEALGKLRPDEKVVLMLTLPTKANLYLSLQGHPNVVRLVAVAAGYNRKEACKFLKQNVNMIGGFGRALVEGLSVKQKEAEFSKVLDQSCSISSSASKTSSARDEQAAKLSSQAGFFVCFDQTQSLPKLLSAYGISESEYADEAAMLMQAHKMHTRIITNPQFNGSRCVGVILREHAISMNIKKLSAAKYLWDVMRILPFVKIDRGLVPERDGVCQMAEIPEIDKKLASAIRAGFVGTLTRSLIRLPNSRGIRNAIQQQLDIAMVILMKGLVPIVQIEVDVSSPDRTKMERLLVNALLRGLEELGSSQRIILDLPVPAFAGTYNQLVEQRNVIRVIARPGGASRVEACKMLKENIGMSAAFGKGFTEGLHIKQTEKQFTGQIVQSCTLLYNASRNPTDAQVITSDKSSSQKVEGASEVSMGA